MTEEQNARDSGNAVLVVNLNVCDIPENLRKKLARLCPLDGDVRVLDLADYPSFPLSVRSLKRKTLREYSETFHSSVCEKIERSVRKVDGLLSVKDAKTAGQSGFLPWEMLRSEVLCEISDYGAELFLLDRILDTEKPSRIIFINAVPYVDFRAELLFEKILRLIEWHGIPCVQLASASVAEKKFKKTVVRFFRKLNFWRLRLIHQFKSKSVSAGTVFLCGFSGRTDLELMEPVLENLKKQDSRFCLLLPGMSSEKTLGLMIAARKLGIPYRFLHDLPGGLAPEREQEIEKMRTEMLRLFKDALSQDSTAQSGAHLWKVFQPGAARWFSPEAFKKFFVLAEKAENLFKAGARGVLLPNEESAAQRIFAFAAARAGTKSAVLLRYHGQLSGGKAVRFPETGFVSDLWAVLGPRSGKELAELGIAPSDIAVTGLPKFHAGPLLKPDLASLLKKLGVNKKYSGIFVWSLQGFPEEGPMLARMFEAMKEFPHKLLVVRSHPFPEEIFKMDMTSRRNVLFDRKSDLSELIMNSDLLMASTSITVFNAILSDKPVVILDLFSRFYFHLFVKENAALAVTKFSQIVPSFKKALDDPETRNLLKDGRRKIIADFTPGNEEPPVSSISALLLKQFS